MTLFNKAFTRGQPPEKVALWDEVIDDYKCMQNSGLFRLASNDVVKGIVTAFFSGFTTVVLALVGTGVGLFTLDLKQILLAAIGVGIVSALGYLQKNFFTDNDKHETVAGIIPTK